MGKKQRRAPKDDSDSGMDWITLASFDFEDGGMCLLDNSSGDGQRSLIIKFNRQKGRKTTYIKAWFTEGDTDRGASGVLTVLRQPFDHIPVVFYGEREDILRRLATGTIKTIRAQLRGEPFPLPEELEGEDIGLAEPR